MGVCVCAHVHMRVHVCVRTSVCVHVHVCVSLQAILWAKWR